MSCLAAFERAGPVTGATVDTVADRLVAIAAGERVRRTAGPGGAVTIALTVASGATLVPVEVSVDRAAGQVLVRLGQAAGPVGAVDGELLLRRVAEHLGLRVLSIPDVFPGAAGPAL
jgi:hypothetical protein